MCACELSVQIKRKELGYIERRGEQVNMCVYIEEHKLSEKQ